MKTKHFLLLIFILLGINSYSQEIKPNRILELAKAIKTSKIEKQGSTVKQAIYNIKLLKKIIITLLKIAQKCLSRTKLSNLLRL